MTADQHGPTDARDLLGAYALDAVDDIERRAVDRLVATDPAAAHELAGLTATAAMLGAAVAARPPADLRAAVLAEAARTAQVSRPAAAGARGSGASARRPGVPRRTVWLAVAATAVGAALIPSGLAWQQAQQTQRAQEQARAVADLLADPQARLVRSEVTGGGTAVAVLAADSALFSASGLAEPGDGKAYQLWVLHDGAAASAGVLADDDGQVRAIAADFAPGDSLAVTVEPAGGSTQPTTDPLVVLESA
ncbi:anti-sigma factor [Pengzhenrongella sicca]|uniref:Regulator of SigK n=1 Tax=Pengzhenrongella sicca TaxID=2819238 RepID=A0A8A4ZBV5_9MICO|nr:anti-sigma factor [Pengzhenrongella sicca]QTE29470.1 anti-sigma factor [Pengzhenrongella sicca]